MAAASACAASVSWSTTTVMSKSSDRSVEEVVDVDARPRDDFGFVVPQPKGQLAERDGQLHLLRLRLGERKSHQGPWKLLRVGLGRIRGRISGGVRDSKHFHV